MLNAELDGCEGIFHLVCHLLGHLAPGQDPLGPEFIGHVLQTQHRPSQRPLTRYPSGPNPNPSLAHLELGVGLPNPIPEIEVHPLHQLLGLTLPTGKELTHDDGFFQ